MSETVEHDDGADGDADREHAVRPASPAPPAPASCGASTPAVEVAHERAAVRVAGTSRPAAPPAAAARGSAGRARVSRHRVRPRRQRTAGRSPGRSATMRPCRRHARLAVGGDDARRRAGGRTAARRRRRRRRGDRRRRLHRAVDGASTSPWPTRRCASSCSSASTSASAPAAATAGGARRCWPTGLTTLADRHGRDAAIAMQRAMHATVDEVGEVLAAEGVDAGVRQGRHDHARPHAGPARPAGRRGSRRPGRSASATDDLRWLERRRAAASGAARPPPRRRCSRRTARRSTRCAWSTAWPRRPSGGACRIHERTPVVAIEPRPGWSRPHGRVRADVVVLATEAYTVELPGHHRDVVPLYSLMIGSEPLTAEQWDGIGLAERPTFHDARNLIIYGQRTADGRIAFGGRGAPYHFGSRIDAAFDRDERVRDDAGRARPRAVPGARRRRLPVPLGRPARRAPGLAVRRALRPGDRHWPSPVATSATASRRRTSPGARWPT